MSDDEDQQPADAAPRIAADDFAAAERIAALRGQVYASMLRRHTVSRSLAWGLLLLGAIMLFVAGLIVAFVLTFITSAFVEEGIGFRGWLIVYFIAIVPLLIWQERRTRGGFFTLAVTDVDLTRDPDSVGDYLLRRSQQHAIAVVEMLLWGPRAFLAGFRTLRGIRQTGLDIVLPEAADTLTLLLTLDGGVKIKDLVGPGEDPMRLMPVLKWLDVHDYIGISSRGDRVWVSSFAKKQFPMDKSVVRSP